MKDKISLDMYSSMPVSKAVLKNAVPAMVSMLMVLIYNMADTFFIGQTGDAFQVAAISLATPVFLLFLALGTMFGIGGTSVISRAMGEGRRDYARKVSAFCMWGCVFVGIVMTALLWIFMDQILAVLCASANTWDFARDYLRIVALCGPFVLIGSCFSNILRAEGQSTKAMMGMLVGNLINVVLDPIMIQGFGWDIAGAAIATVIGNVIGAGYYILYFVQGKSSLSANIRDVTLKDSVCKGVLAIGIPAALGSILMSVSQIILNGQMAAYGDMAVAGVGVAGKVIMITGMICIGLGQGVQPLLGYCVGAKTWDRYKKILSFSVVFALALGMVLTGICYLFAGQIVRAFLSDTNAFGFGVRFVRILLTTSATFGVYCVLLNALQAMGAAGASLLINLSRQGIIFIPTLFVMKYLLGSNGLVWAQPVSDILSLVLAALMYMYIVASRKTMCENASVNTEVVLEASKI